MTKRNLLCLLSCLISFQLIAQTFISNVHLINPETKQIIPAQTIGFNGNTITSVQSAKKARIPANATIIDGQGKYLLPGLTDAHIHFFQSGGLYTRPDAMDLRKIQPYKTELAWVHENMEDILRRYTKVGITSVFDVGANYHFLQQRDSFANKPYAPAIYMTGPLLTTWEPAEFENLKDEEPFLLVKTPADGQLFVQKQLAYHPDFIKIWYIINSPNIEKEARELLPIVKSIIDEAHKNKLKVAVHATERITAQLAVENGADFLVHGIEDEIINDDFIRLLQTKKTILCPTLIVADGYSKTMGQNNHPSFYELNTANPLQIGSLEDLKHLPDTAMINALKKQMNLPQVKHYFSKIDSIRMVNLKKMADAGITIVAGTDAGNIGTQHAASYIAELYAMQASGMSNWQILQSATSNAAKILNKENTTGNIAVGKIADMILLNSNPVEQLENLTNIELVINKGNIINPDTIIKESALALVQRQLNAYNAGNIDAFLEPYAEDVALYNFPDTLVSKGKESMRKDYGDMFKQFPNLHCEIKERIIQGHFIIDKESVSGFGKNKLEATVIYQIDNNKISKVYFIQ